MVADMANGLAKLPIAARVVAIIGVPGVLAFWFAWFLTTSHAEQSQRVEDGVGQLDAQHIAGQRLQADTVRVLEHLDETLRQQTGVLVRVCENTSRSEAERVACRRAP